MDKMLVNAREDLDAIATAMANLRGLKVIRSSKLVGDLGEWVVASLYGGQLAANLNQKGWDVDVGGELIQVKSHAKSRTNNTRFSLVSGEIGSFQILCIVVFSEDFYIKEFYEVPAASAIQLRNNSDKRLVWSRISGFKLTRGHLSKKPGFKKIAWLFHSDAD